MAYDPAKASLLTQLLQQGLTDDQALAKAGITGDDIYNYMLESDGTVGPLDFGFPKSPGVPYNAAQLAQLKAEENPPASTVHTISSTTSSTETVSGGGSTTIIDNPPLATDASNAYGAQADGINSQIQAINKQLGPTTFGGDTNLTAEQRDALTSQRSDLYNQYNEARDAQNAATIPVPPTVVTEPNTNTTINTTTTVNASTGANVSTAEDASVSQQQNAASGPTTPASTIITGPAPVPVAEASAASGQVPALNSLGPGEEIVNSPNAAMPANIQAMIDNARQQQVRSIQAGQSATSTDWRVKLSLAQGADYLYNAGDPGILQPLQVTDGVIFPYTPKIDLTYKAQYSPYELTHSNYKGYFYQSSMVDAFTVTGMFTAQSTTDATYLLAVIHFFRSVTKMFYGQDAQRGSPPPLVFLSGLGDYQFNNHPCLVSQFTYSLPDDVDYIRAQYSNNANLNQTAQNNAQKYAAINSSAISSMRLNNAGINLGALPPPLFGGSSMPNLAQGSPTYVPTKMSISISLLPVNTRQQVSQQFSLRDYATGSLLRGGYW